jgi:acetyl-CoA carboxylase biotin carboxylase subunit
MGEAAVKVSKACGYYNAGTVEFLYQDGEFYFLEMNTRLQVEHPVTELVTGLDLVEWQLRIAAGERLTISQENVSWTGSAIECRVYAEDPARQFMPSPGRITHLHEPSGPGLRLDSGIYAGFTVPLDYDPLLAKLAAWGPSRERAIARIDRALAEYSIAGIRTNIEFFREILADPEFLAGRLSTSFLEGFFARQRARETPLEAEAAAALALAASLAKPSAARMNGAVSGWLAAARQGALR